MDAFVRTGHPILFGAIVVFAIIEMCLAAWITAKYNAHHNFPNSGLRARVRYTLFVSIWTVLFGSVYMALFISMTGSWITGIASHFVFLFVTWVFWLAAAASLTQSFGGALDCHTNTEFVYCGHLNALAGFAWLIWVVLTIMLIIVIFQGAFRMKQGEGVASPMVEV